MVQAVKRTFGARKEIPQPPMGFRGSWPEYVCYRELRKQGYEEGLDFSFQSSQLGGRQELGGVVIDFLFRNPPALAVEVNGRYYHYNRSDQQAGISSGRDAYVRAQMASLGFKVVFIDDSDLLNDPPYYVREALQYRDHSELRI